MVDAKRVSGGRKVGLIVAAVVGAAAAAFVVSFVISYLRARNTDWGAQFDRNLVEAPATAALFATFRDEFPDDYRRFRAATVDKLSHGASAEQVRQDAFAFMRGFSMAHRAGLAQAPHVELAAFREAQLRAASALQGESADYCGHFAMAGLHPEDRPGAASLAAINDAAVAQFKAVAAGTHRPAGRSGRPGKADMRALMAGMTAQGLNEADVQLGLSGALPGAAPAQQCRIGLAMLRAVAALPPAQADRFTAAFVTAQ